MRIHVGLGPVSAKLMCGLVCLNYTANRCRLSEPTDLCFGYRRTQFIHATRDDRLQCVNAVSVTTIFSAVSLLKCLFSNRLFIYCTELKFYYCKIAIEINRIDNYDIELFDGAYAYMR